jgi:para-aminobenzoate synthetase component 1
VELLCGRDETSPARVERALAELDRMLDARRTAGGVTETGLLVLLAYELCGASRPPAEGTPALAVLAVDASLRFLPDGEVLLTARGAGAGSRERAERLLDQAERAGADLGGARPARLAGRPRTSLPREAYLRAVSRLRRHILRGDVYQANLCQCFDAPYGGDPLDLYAALVREGPAPKSAFVRGPGFALASLSPETFLRADGTGRIATWPIKGTRARGSTEEADRDAARQLCASPKDRAELLMIVDLERNDLSRVCTAGSVRVPELAALRSFATVHHLVAHVEGRLRAEVTCSDLIRATFPGGSISGAPKIRARQILERLEPLPRGLFTGCLLWCADDGTLDSSILIRSWTFDGQTARLGAGGGVVADSDPEQEWLESNHKARSLARGLGFDPEEATCAR